MRKKNDPVNYTPANDRGFTLIEVMVAIAIFAVGFLAVGSMQIASINANAKSRVRTEATALATAKIEQFMGQKYDDIGSAGSEIRGPFTTSWSVDTLGDTKTILITVSWVSKNRTQSVNLNYKAVNVGFYEG